MSQARLLEPHSAPCATPATSCRSQENSRTPRLAPQSTSYSAFAAREAVICGSRVMALFTPSRARAASPSSWLAANALFTLSANTKSRVLAVWARTSYGQRCPHRACFCTCLLMCASFLIASQTSLLASASSHSCGPSRNPSLDAF